MFIREIKQKGRKGKQYTYHRLVETSRTDEGPRQRTIINLGILSIAKEKWHLLASRIAANLKGQISFIEEGAEIESLAYYHAQRILNKEHSGREHLPAAEVLLNSLEVIDSRTIGAEGVGLSWLRYLKLDDLFIRLGLNERQRKLAIMSILGRLIFPGSERRTGLWIKRLSGLGELLGYDFRGISKNSLYEISYGQKRSQQLNERYSGSYFLRTNRKDLDKETVWHVYNLIRRIESSFESLKSHLGFRPIYHQKETRSDATYLYPYWHITY